MTNIKHVPFNLKLYSLYAGMGVVGSLIAAYFFGVYVELMESAVWKLVLGYGIVITSAAIILGWAGVRSEASYKSEMQSRITYLQPIRYKNYRGEIGEYLIYPLHIFYGSNDFHKIPQWLMAADKYDPENLSKEPERRIFALADIQKIYHINEE
jgi:hypothetical protein